MKVAARSLSRKIPGTEVSEDQIACARKLEALAKREIATGFALLNAHAAVDTWGVLETYVRNLLVAWLHNVPEAQTLDELKKVRLSFSDFS
jgi:hypothetical protein